MLSDESRPIIAATLPVVRQHLKEIADRFYVHMFEARPDLLDGLFNRGNQADGAQQQALAGSIAAFAHHVMQNPDELPDGLLARISHKHASLGLRPEQYDIVHEHLMWAIVDVLGAAVTAEVAAAWDEVYWLMANVLINQERDLYRTADLTAETVWEQWKIAGKRRETDDVTSFVLRPVSGRPGPVSLPGQYVSVRIPMADGVRQPRQYSLSAADDGTFRQITVKRVQRSTTPAGEVSNALHDRFQVGDTVELSAPFGEVVLERSSAPLVLLSAGIGITPHAGMLSHLAATPDKRDIRVLHVDRSTDATILERQIRADLEKIELGDLIVWDSTGGRPDVPGRRRAGRMDLDQVAFPEGADYYLCGPLNFMQNVRGALLERGIPSRSIHYEVFGPDLWIADSEKETARLNHRVAG